MVVARQSPHTSRKNPASQSKDADTKIMSNKNEPTGKSPLIKTHNQTSGSRKTRQHSASTSRLRSKSSNVLSHPVGLPECIPANAARAFFSATPAVQRQLILDASEPDLIQYPRQPVLQSVVRLKSEGTVCFCRDMQLCPLAASSTPLEDTPNFDGLTYQFYPTDDGWWKMRDIVLQLGKLSSDQI